MPRTKNEVPTLFVLRNRWCFKLNDARKTLCELTPEQQAQVDKGRKPKPTADQHAELIRVLNEVQPTRRDETMRVDDLCNQYLTNRHGKVVEKKHAYYVMVLGRLCARDGASAVGDITPDMVQTFVSSQKTWASLSSQRSALKVILQAFNFAVVNRIIPSSPLIALGKALAVDAPEQRREVYITPEQEAALLNEMSDATAALFRALMGTGRRPDELAALKKSEVMVIHGKIVWRMEEHKNRKKTGKPETIDHLTLDMQDLTRQLLADETNKTPYLFVTKQKKQWTGFNMVAALGHAVGRVRKLRPELGLSDDVTPYAARHSFITRCLLKGIALPVVARWVGNSPITLQKHYNQLELAGATATAHYVAMLSRA